MALATLFTGPTPSWGPVLQPLADLAHAAGLIAAGVIVGRLSAAALPRLHLRWTWALVALVPAVPMCAAAGWRGLFLPVAAVTAARRGHRRHRREIHGGGAVAAAAKSRVGPFELASRLVARASASHRGRHAAAGLRVGRDATGRAVHVPIGADRGASHVLIVGATGSGKTVTATSISVSAIRAGLACVALDPKGDRQVEIRLRAAADGAGRPFVMWTPEGPSIYNPFARGSETEIADKALAGERFTEPHDLRHAQRYLGHAVRVLQGTGEPVSLAALVRVLDPIRLEVEGRRLPAERAQPVFDYLDSLTARQARDLAGTRDRLAVLAESDAGRWLDPATPAQSGTFDLLEVVRGGAVAYLRLDADRRPLLAQMLGAAIVQDLLTTAAALQADPAPCVVTIDEFSAVAAPQVVRLFGRARSAGLSLVLATQELSDLRLPGAPALLEQVLGNVATVIAHRQVVPESARMIAALAGTRSGWTAAHRSDGTATYSPAREPVLAPEEIAGLPPGVAAVLRTDAQGAGALRIARMLGPSEVAR